MEHLLRNIARNKQVLDVGCGDGDFTCTIAHDCQTVLAFDNDKKKVKKLLRTLCREKLTNVALFDREMQSIDDFIIDVAICRISVNGKEGDLLMTAFNLMNSYRPVMIVRVGHKVNVSSYDIGKIMFDLNYMYPIPYDTHYVYFPFYTCPLLRKFYLQGKTTWQMQIEERIRYVYDGQNSYRVFTVSDTEIRIIFNDVVRIGTISENQIAFDNGIKWFAK